jgi:hypothetical protein
MTVCIGASEMQVGTESPEAGPSTAPMGITEKLPNNLHNRFIGDVLQS